LSDFFTNSPGHPVQQRNGESMSAKKTRRKEKEIEKMKQKMKHFQKATEKIEFPSIH
jgi:hypothetical protein